jgi:hypothetical protein
MTRPLNSDPLRNFRYNVTITHPQIPTFARLGFMAVSGLSVQNEVIPYREGGNNTTALPLDAPVLTPSGWKRMGEIEVGDRIIDPMGEDSKATDLLPVVTKDVYRVTLGDGSQALACWGHRWQTEVRTSNNTLTKRDLSTLEMKELVDERFPRGGDKYHVRLPAMTPMQFEMRPELPLDPWLLGILLAEGDLSGDSVGVASVDQEIIARIESLLPDGHVLWTSAKEPAKHRIVVSNDVPGARNRHGRNKVRETLRELGLLGKHAWDKVIPEPYLWASVADRLALLQGIMDGDGWVDTRHSVQFASTSQELTKGVRTLIYSLGGRCGATVYATNRSYTRLGESYPARDVWSFSGISDLGSMVPFTLQRKVDRFALSAKTSSQFRRVRSVEFVGQQEVRCITVSAESHMFVAYDFVPTKNTRKMPGQSDYGALSFTRGMMAAPVIVGQGGGSGPGTTNVSGQNTTEAYTWFQQIFSVQAGSGFGGATTDFRVGVVIDLLAHPITTGAMAAGIDNPPPIKARWLVYNAWPMSLSYSDLEAGGNAVVIENLQLAHEGWTLVTATNDPASFLSVSSGFSG